MKLRAFCGLVLGPRWRFRASAAAATPSRPSSWRTRATSRDVDVDGAISKYEQATQLDPDQPSHPLQAGDGLQEEGSVGQGLRRRWRARRSRAEVRELLVRARYALESKPRRRRSVGRGEGAVSRSASRAIPTTRTATTSSATPTSGPTTSRRRSRTTPRRSSTSRRAPLLHALADLYLAPRLHDQAEQVLKEALAFAKATRQTSTSSACTCSCRRSTRTKGQMNEMVAELEARAKSSRPTSDPEILYNLGSAPTRC